MKCPNWDKGCEWQGDLGDTAQHRGTKCQMEAILCTTGCKETILRGYLKRHAETCPQRAYKCPHCQFEDTFVNVTTSPCRRWLKNSPTCYPRPPWVIKMEGFQEKMEGNEEWFSDPVYSHFGGYKMCLKVYANGLSDGKGTHVSVYVCLMRGDNVDNLKWPFKGTVKVSLLNQLEDGQHHTREPWALTDNVPEGTKRRVTEGERAVKGWGLPEFIPQEDLIYMNCQYLKDDILFFDVECIEPKLD